MFFCFLLRLKPDWLWKGVGEYLCMVKSLDHKLVRGRSISDANLLDNFFTCHFQGKCTKSLLFLINEVVSWTGTNRLFLNTPLLVKVFWVCVVFCSCCCCFVLFFCFFCFLFCFYAKELFWNKCIYAFAFESNSYFSIKFCINTFLCFFFLFIGSMLMICSMFCVDQISAMNSFGMNLRLLNQQKV